MACSSLSINAVYLSLYSSTYAWNLVKHYERHTHSEDQIALCEKTNQSAEPDAEMIQMFQLSDRKFKITIINVSKSWLEMVDSVQKQMGEF